MQNKIGDCNLKLAVVSSLCRKAQRCYTIASSGHCRGENEDGEFFQIPRQYVFYLICVIWQGKSANEYCVTNAPNFMLLVQPSQLVFFLFFFRS